MFIEKGMHGLLVPEGRYVCFSKLTICEGNENNELISTRRTISKSLYRINRDVHPAPGRCGFLTAPGITQNSRPF